MSSNLLGRVARAPLGIAAVVFQDRGVGGLGAPLLLDLAAGVLGQSGQDSAGEVCRSPVGLRRLASDSLPQIGTIQGRISSATSGHARAVPEVSVLLIS